MKRFAVLLGTLTVAASVGAYAHAAPAVPAAIALEGETAGSLTPGGPPARLIVHVRNPGRADEHVHEISGVVADIPGCPGTWFVVAPVAYDRDVAAGTSGPDVTTTVTMLDSGTNQDACASAPLTISLSTA